MTYQNEAVAREALAARVATLSDLRTIVGAPVFKRSQI